MKPKLATKLTKKGLIKIDWLWWYKAVGLCYVMGWTIKDIKEMTIEEIEKVSAILSSMEGVSGKKDRREMSKIMKRTDNVRTDIDNIIKNGRE